MLNSTIISISQMRREIFTYAIINCLVYILLLMLFKYLGLLHIYGLRMVNYLVLGVLSIVQVRRLIIQHAACVPFLQTFFMVLLTGAFSFFLLGIFLLAYSFTDPYLNPLYATHYSGIRLVPSLFVFFEGTGASTIIGLITMLYSTQFESGEKGI